MEHSGLVYKINKGKNHKVLYPIPITQYPLPNTQYPIPISTNIKFLKG